MVLFKKTKKTAESPKTAKPLDLSQEEPRTLSKQSSFGRVGSSSGTWQILKRPKVSEKATKLVDRRQYIFLVNKRSTKPEIKSAVEEAYRVRVGRVNIVRIKGKRKQWRRQMGKLPDIKKAIVTLREGDKIELT